ncbi:GNAT superfamily N-acetyltransferase [Rhizobium sp. BK529]|uniref:GNAT family N-acetyltransferase n=1 Tax=unclassified Rhizobium TaxID=2613769 RepID=UPI0010450CCD|nr:MULTISPECIES: GNAT family N-acetyltransferase [unclassified Rhizobium]MBB3590550.1 GNAT superfamily N-acetyltransferase [Rhizobium sp. BK529]TCS05238.1 N-acetylglutamate synthase-like GNAT family acetyltransferase [Rhizobium sp. BK418]
MRIRQATRDDFDALRSIELASFETLRAAGAVSGEPEASSDEELQHYLEHALLYAACDHSDLPVGYAGAYVAEKSLHIGEMDVHPDFQKKGLGRRLMETLLAEGRSRKLAEATLTTDRFAPFNAPFYVSLGFRLLEKDECSPRLQAILTSEAEKGLDPFRRIGMVLSF